MDGAGAKYYPQTDLHVALMFLADVHDKIVLVIDRSDYFPYVRREIMRILGTPSFNEPTRMRYTNLGKTITLVSKQGHDYEQDLRGIDARMVYYVGGWNVDDVRHSDYCQCEVPSESAGYYHGTDGRLHASVLCDECGNRIGGKRIVNASQMPKA